MANRAPVYDPHVFSINDLKQLGSKKLPIATREYYNGGAMDESTLRENEEAFAQYKIRPRILRNVSGINTSTTIFDTEVSLPFGFSPSAMHKLAHPDGEVATSRAAAKFNIPMCLSSYSTTSLEEVGEQGLGNPYTMQMCVVRDRSITKQLLERAEGPQAAGYKALFLSVDVPVLGRRLNEMKNDFTLPEGLGFPNILSSGNEEFSNDGGPREYDDTLEWQEIIPWLRANTKMQIWLKGAPVTTPLDVETAIHYKINGVIVSNHGGRQLDGLPSTIDALREIAPTARGRIPIAFDGGIRRGSDIFKALALGAQFCFLGRAAIWGLAYNGQEGIELALKLLGDELRTTMALAGCRSIKDISQDHLSYKNSNGLLCKL